MQQQHDQLSTGTVNVLVSLVDCARLIDSSSLALDDDQIETAIAVRYSNTSAGVPVDWNEAAGEDVPVPTPTTAHGMSDPELPACCRLLQSLDDAVVDCSTCLEQAWATLEPSFTHEELGLAEKLLASVRSRGRAGFAKRELKVSSIEGRIRRTQFNFLRR